MSAGAILLALAMSGTPVALILLWVWADEKLAERQDKRRREEQDRQVTAEWLALLAAVEPQVHDQLVCEEIERREWSS